MYHFWKQRLRAKIDLSDSHQGNSRLFLLNKGFFDNNHEYRIGSVHFLGRF
jgi:hypothetical protein